MGLWGRFSIAMGVLCCACSFDGQGTTTEAPALEDDESPTSSESTTGEPSPSGDGTTAMAGSSGQPDPTTSPVTTEARRTTGPGEPDPETTSGLGESSSSSGGGEETQGAVDCARPRTYMLGPADAVLSGPMQMGSISGIDHVFSGSENEGEAAYTFDVECPSVYRVFARVRDDVAGVNQCCDPDSFFVEFAGQMATWFYGCDTVVDGFSWQVVESALPGQNCGDPEVMFFDLSVGQHELVFRNREPSYQGSFAGLAEIVLTNDPTYVPNSF